jgi:putative transposase
MPRANRYLVPGCIYHLTHRCHDREFLFRFAKDRNGYHRRLRQAVLSTRVCLLTYIITSNHVHLVVWMENPGQIAILMQEAAGSLPATITGAKNGVGHFGRGAITPRWSIRESICGNACSTLS